MAETKKIRVLQLCEHFGGKESQLHGVARTFQWWMPRFDRTRFEVWLCSRKGYDKAAEQMIRCGVAPLYLGYGKYDPRNLFKLMRLIRELRIDILHLHGYGAGTWGRIAGFLMRKPAIIHGRGNYHSVPFLQQVVERLLGPFTRYGLAVSASTGDYMVRQWHIPASAVQVVYNGVPFDEIRVRPREWIESFRKEQGAGPGDKVVGIVGRLEDFKGHREAFRALQEVRRTLPNVFIWVLGDGVFEEELHAWLEQQGMRAEVKMLGFRRDAREVIQCFDLQLFPSYREGTPNTLYEALAVGNPIVATQIDGQAEILEDGKTAVMVPAGDVEAMARQMLRVLQDGGLASSLRAAAKARSEDFDGMRCIEKIQGLYERIMAERR